MLSTINLSNINVKIIQFEHGHLKKFECSEISELLSMHGYKLFWGGHEADSVAVHKDFVPI